MVEIPIRTSSKRVLERDRDYINADIKAYKRKLKSQSPYNSEFWAQATVIADLEVKRGEITRKISIQDFTPENNLATFDNTNKAKDLFLQIKAAETNKRLYADQAERLKTDGDQQKSLRRSFIALFTTSTLGFSRLKTGMGQRDPSDQSSFRQACLISYDAKHPDPRSPFLWCPITKKWCGEEGTKAAHLFAYKHGQEMMDSIFGQIRPEELFSPLNGLILSTQAEKYMDQGFLAIVPRIPNNPSEQDITNWNLSSPKEYKIRILDPKWDRANQFISPDSEKVWGDLDGEPVEFRNDFRPRARYLYFLYCVQMLKRAWSEGEQGKTLSKEMKRLYWGTPGKYLPKYMLLAFVEEIGHEYEQLLEGATEDQEVCEGGEKILLAASVNQIKAAVEARNEDELESESESESESEEIEEVNEEGEKNEL